MESLLEDFYASLGSRYISKETKESWIPRGSAQVTSLAQDLQQTIRRRAPLLLYDMDVRGAQGGDTDGAILEQLQSIDVYEVQQIHIVRKLHSAENSCEFTAACQPWSSSRKPATLYVTQRFDYFDVALVLNRAVMRKAKLNDTLLLATLLSTSLENLKKKGFPVDRLITPQREKADALKKVVPAPVAQTAQGSLPTSTPTLSDDMLRLQQAFPDCDPAYMAQLLRANNGDVEQTSNELLDGEYPVASRKGSTQQPQQNGTDDAEATSSSPFLPRQSESGSLASQAAAAIAQQAARAPPQVPSSLVDSVRNLMRGFGGSVGLKGATGLDGTASTSSRTVSQANDRHRRGGQPLTDEMLARSLADSVRSCGGNAPESLITPATELLVESQTSHCETIPAQNLGLVGQVRVGDIRFPFYVDHGVEPQTAHALYLVDDGTPTPSHPIALQCFARVLHELCGVFQLNPGAVHIYYAPMDRTESIAFNANRSLFFNYAYFMDMHAPTILRRLDVRRRSDLEVSLAQLGSTVFTYWFMSFCHELAHNFVGYDLCQWFVCVSPRSR